MSTQAEWEASKQAGREGRIYTGGDFAAHQLGLWEGGHAKSSRFSGNSSGSWGSTNSPSSYTAPISTPSYRASPTYHGGGGRGYSGASASAVGIATRKDERPDAQSSAISGARYVRL